MIILAYQDVSKRCLIQLPWYGNQTEVSNFCSITNIDSDTNTNRNKTEKHKLLGLNDACKIKNKNRTKNVYIYATTTKNKKNKRAPEKKIKYLLYIQ